MIARPLLAAATMCLGMAMQAEHLVGGSVDYRCLGGNFYEITLTIYRDCSGFQVIPQPLKFRNDCGVNFTISNLQVQETEQVAPLCPSQVGNSTCDGGTLPGMQKHIFRHTLYLSPCSGWKISWSVCCRPPTLNLVGFPGLYIEAQLDNTGGACNDSPFFADDPPPFVCVGQQMNYDPHVVETDGDSLVFSLVDARYAAPNPEVILYQPPWYGAIPYADLTIDPVTGRISFLPSLQGLIAVVVLVDEYAPGGQWKGSSMRDFMFTVTACDNTIPSISAGLIASLTGDGQVNGDRSATLCMGGSGCMTMEYHDADATQSLLVTSNVDLALPGVEWTVSGSNPAVLTLCWDTLAAMAGTKHFAVKVLDDKCPLRGLQTYTYTMLIEAPGPILAGDALACSLTPAFYLGDSMAQAPPDGGQWTGPDGMAHSGWFDPADDTPGEYTYSIVTAAGCSSSATVTVTMIPDDDPLCEFLSVGEQALPYLSVWPNPTNGPLAITGLRPELGAVRLELLDGTGRVVWSHQTFHTDGLRLVLPDRLAPGRYLLRAMQGGRLLRSLPVVLAR